MDLAIASPGFVAVRADLAAWIVLFGALGDAHALSRVVLDLAHATSTAVDFRAWIVWREEEIVRLVEGCDLPTHKSFGSTQFQLLSHVECGTARPSRERARFRASSLVSKSNRG